jgi:hypothetical protein
MNLSSDSELNVAITIQQTTLPHELDQINARIEYTDEKINKLAFELYGSGEEERRIIV